MLSDEDREAVRRAGVRLIVHNKNDDLYTAVERIASDAARAAERALVERIEALADSDHRFTGMNCACGRELNSPRGWLIHVVRAALRPEAATTEGACAPSPECSCQCHRMGLLGVSHVAPCCTGSTRGGNDE